MDSGGVVWRLDRLAYENRGAWMRGLPRTFIAFGDDGTGNPFVMKLSDDSGDEVLRWNWLDGAVELSEGSMENFIAKWVEGHD